MARLSFTEQGQLIAAVEPSQAVFDLFDPAHLKVGDTVTAQEELHFRLRKIQTKDGREWLAAFTSEEEVRKGESTSTLAISMEDHLKAVLDMDNVAGVIINPWGQSFLMDKELIHVEYNWGELEIYSNTQYKLSEECMPYAAAPTAINIEPDDIDVSDTVTFVWEMLIIEI